MRRHGQNDDGDAGLVDGADAGTIAAGPTAVAVLLGPEMPDEAIVPVVPFLAADLVHRVGGVVVAVVVVLAVVEVPLEVIDRLGHDLFNLLFAAFVGGVARQKEDAGAGGGAGEARAALAGHV